MKDAFMLFCGCLQIKMVQISTTTPRRQMTTMLHTSVLTRASMAWVRMRHIPTMHATSVQRQEVLEVGTLREGAWKPFGDVCVAYLIVQSWWRRFLRWRRSPKWGASAGYTWTWPENLCLLSQVPLRTLIQKHMINIHHLSNQHSYADTINYSVLWHCWTIHRISYRNIKMHIATSV